MSRELEIKLTIESAELDLKLLKLEEFIESPAMSELQPYAAELLQEQYEVMCSYLKILEKRIDLL